MCPNEHTRAHQSAGRHAARATAERYPWSAMVATMLDLHDVAPRRISA